MKMLFSCLLACSGLAAGAQTPNGERSAAEPPAPISKPLPPVKPMTAVITDDVAPPPPPPPPPPPAIMATAPVLETPPAPPAPPPPPARKKGN